VSIAIASLIVLVIVAIIAVPILIRVLGEAGSRNENRPGGSGTEERDETHRTSGPSRD
jgi:hypothetical protein